jgi:hypothetical protein
MPPPGQRAAVAYGMPPAGPGAPVPYGTPLPEATRLRLQRSLLALAVAALSGPGGLAAHLRASLATSGLVASGALDGGTALGAASSDGVMAEAGAVGGRCATETGVARHLLASVSLPLDIGAATEIIPAHLRRAVAVRHPRCAFPGCEQPVSVCDVHHLIPAPAAARRPWPTSCRSARSTT